MLRNFCSLFVMATFASSAVVGLGACSADVSGPNTASEDSASTKEEPTLTTGAATPPSNPSQFVVAGNTLFFVAETAAAGLELWKSDGSEAGTRLVLDILPGAEASMVRGLTAVGNQVFFVAYTDEGGDQLWTSDGSETGTKKLTSLQNGVWEGFGVLDGVVYFQGDDGTSGLELWRSDGTVDGTRMVMDLWPGSDGSAPHGFGAMGGKLFFSAGDSEHGNELWVSEGTAATTHLVKDITPGEASSVTGPMVVAGNHVFFQAEDGVHSYELWVTDGTEAGTRMVKDIGPGEAEAHLGWTVPMGSTLFFHADDGKNGLELWKSDGTEKGTVMVKNINAGSRSAEPRGLVVADNQLYFFADYGTDANPKQGLFRSSGTKLGTSLVRGNLQLGYNWFAPPFITAVGATVYFNVRTTKTGAELWNASRKGWLGAVVTQVKDINAGAADSNLGEMVSFKGKLYFSADDGVHGNELWMSNGTSKGTLLVKDIHELGLSSGYCLEVSGEGTWPTADGSEPFYAYGAKNFSTLEAAEAGQLPDANNVITAGSCQSLVVDCSNAPARPLCGKDMSSSDEEERFPFANRCELENWVKTRALGEDAADSDSAMLFYYDGSC